MKSTICTTCLILKKKKPGYKLLKGIIVRYKKLTADVVIGLSYGDESKGKVTNSLLKSGDYTHCVRFSGGHNCGHTIYKDGKKLVTHSIPSGVLQGIKSIIGPGCVVNLELLEKEIEELEKEGINVRDNLFIDQRVNVITTKHLEEDGTDTRIGTTRKGNGPAYRDKYDRRGIRIKDLSLKSQYNVIDIYEEFYNNSEKVFALFEGAQGFGLDIDWGDYPYVTSSTCTVGGVVSNGMPPHSIRKIYGVTKAYQTYVGAKKFEPDNEVFKKIREIGKEYGATTGRPRQVNYLDLDELIKASRINGATDIVMSKLDILQEVNEWKLYKNSKLHDLRYEDKFKDYVKTNLLNTCEDLEEVVFSYSPNEI
jgi:adenylosuccinate synthase